MQFIVSSWLWLFERLFFINIVLSIIIVFFQRREPRSVWTWLLALYFIPIFGILFFLVFGQDYKKSKMFRIKSVQDHLRKMSIIQEHSIRKNAKFLEHTLSEKYIRLLYYNIESGASMLTINNHVDIFTDGRKKFDSLLEDISHAKSYINFQYYIIKNDYLFDSIAETLIQKAKEGVQVRVLADGMGARFMPEARWERLRKHGIKVAIFFPATLGRVNLRVNYRNHRKMVIIDGNIGYVGGFNVGKEYLGDSKKFGYWRDTHLRLQGDSVRSLEVRFALDWHYATKENIFLLEQKLGTGELDVESRTLETLEYEQALGIQITTSGPDSETKQIRDNYIALFHAAKDHIYIHTPYFIPDEAILSALTIAIKSGVDVCLMIPSKPDHPFVYSATLSWAGTLLELGGRVYTYQDGFLHAKSVMVDSEVASVGTANMDIRSFELNFEVNATIYHGTTVKKLEEAFLEDMLSCRELTLEVYENRNIIQRVKEQVSRLLSPLL